MRGWLPGPGGRSPLRIGVVGCRLHRCGPRARRPAGRRQDRRRCRIDARERGGGCGPFRCRTGIRRRRVAGGVARRRRGPHLHAEPAPRPAERARDRCGETRDLREASGPRPPGRRTPAGPARPRRGRRHGAVRLSLLSAGSRGSSARGRRLRPVAAHPRHLPAGLAVDGRGRQLARRPGLRRTISCVRRHRLALVRSGRVRDRRSTRRGVRGTGDGAPRATLRRRARSRVRVRREAWRVDVDP